MAEKSGEEVIKQKLKIIKIGENTRQYRKLLVSSAQTVHRAANSATKYLKTINFPVQNIQPI